MKKPEPYLCYYCGKALTRQKRTRDHKHPRSRNGSSAPQNIVDACRRCNQDKGSLLLDEYRRVVAYRIGVEPSTYRFPGELKDMQSEAYQRQLKRQKNKRAQRRAGGLCMRCGRVPARPDRVDCESCAREGNEHRIAKRQAGICPYCYEQNPVIPDTGYCRSCADKVSEASKLQRAERKRLGLCSNCGKVPTRTGYVNCEECAAVFRGNHKQNKKRCFDHYGRTCTCCNLEFDERFLTLDHIQNDGALHREEIGGTLYKWAIDNEFPPILQTNCFNCNMGKSVNGGICPHQETALRSKSFVW